MVEIIPAILTKSADELREFISKAEGVVERVQIDIIDGQFKDNKTIDLAAFKNIETNLLFDFHLMVNEPKSWVEKCIRARADRIIGQIEMMQSQADFVERVQKAGAYAGLAIDLETPVSKLDSAVLNNLDCVLVMSVPAGFGGQKFNPKALDKIKMLNKIRQTNDALFSIIDDGGVTAGNINDLGKVGVDEVSIGRSIFKGNIKENIKEYKRAVHQK